MMSLRRTCINSIEWLELHRHPSAVVALIGWSWLEWGFPHLQRFVRTSQAQQGPVGRGLPLHELKACPRPRDGGGTPGGAVASPTPHRTVRRSCRVRSLRRSFLFFPFFFPLPVVQAPFSAFRLATVSSPRGQSCASSLRQMLVFGSGTSAVGWLGPGRFFGSVLHIGC